jgi:hypothetical protein
MRTAFTLAGLLVALSVPAAGPVLAQEASTGGLPMEPGWAEIGRQRVNDGADSDLAFMKDDRPLTSIRVCALENDIRLRNATASLPGHKRQKLWLPLILKKGQCSDPIDVKDGPERVTHIAFEYEAMGLGLGGAELVVLGLPAER